MRQLQCRAPRRARGTIRARRAVVLVPQIARLRGPGVTCARAEALQSSLRTVPMNGPRLSLALLAAALPLAACGQRDAASTPTTSSVTASSVAPSSSAPAASASAVAPRPAPIPPVPMPAAHQRFAEALDKKCAPEDSDGSTAGMAAAEAARGACIAKGIKVDAARLSADELAVLIDGDPRSPRGKSRDPRGSMWARATDAACRAAGFQQWTDGADKNLGSYEQVRVHACFGHADSDFAYLARTRLEKRAPDWAEYVQAVARSRPDPALAMKRWRRYAGLARRTAPHSLWGCRPMVCRRTDIEWIDHERDLEIVAEGAESLAKALCSSWPELGTAFGGEAACRERMAAHWLPRPPTWAVSSSILLPRTRRRWRRARISPRRPTRPTTGPRMLLAVAVPSTSSGHAPRRSTRRPARIRRW